MHTYQWDSEGLWRAYSGGRYLRLLSSNETNWSLLGSHERLLRDLGAPAIANLKLVSSCDVATSMPIPPWKLSYEICFLYCPPFAVILLRWVIYIEWPESFHRSLALGLGKVIYFLSLLLCILAWSEPLHHRASRCGGFSPTFVFCYWKENLTRLTHAEPSEWVWGQCLFNYLGKLFDLGGPWNFIGRPPHVNMQS